MANHEETNSLSQTANFIHAHIQADLGTQTHKIHTRFPPEPNGYLHIGHAKALCINCGIAKLYGGKFNLRFDDTNPTKEDDEYVKSIIEDVRWLGFDWEDRLFYASDYFEKFYDIAIHLIKNAKAFVCDLTAEEISSYRGSLQEPGRESPYRDRTIRENLDLFARMKAGEFPNGARTLRAKIDMASPNINMRDPVLYRIIHAHHHNTGDTWCIYPTYDYAHPLEDAIEGITHSLCSLEFEDHRPIYDWCVKEAGFKNPPRQIEFAKLRLTNTIMGKRYIRALVDSGKLDGWDDPRLPTLQGMRRRGYTPEAIRNFCESVGVSKAHSMVDIAQLEHYIREDLKPRSPVFMAVLDPLKLVLTNYPEGQTETLTLDNHPEAALGTRIVPFGREVFIEHDDFQENAPAKFHRLKPGAEVRLKGAYIIRCTDVIKNAKGEIEEIHAEYDPATKSASAGSAPKQEPERKVKGTIHWVSAAHAQTAQVRLFEPLAFDDPTQESGYRDNPNSLKTLQACLEPALSQAIAGRSIQFMRHGYFTLDSKLSTPQAPVFNRIVSLKSSYRP